MNARAFKRWWYRNEYVLLSVAWPLFWYAVASYLFYRLFSHLIEKYAELEALLRQCAAH